MTAIRALWLSPVSWCISASGTFQFNAGGSQLLIGASESHNKYSLYDFKQRDF